MRILYRGSLDSCNYACTYCPFAKNDATREAHERDRREVERFVAHIERERERTYGIFFTPQAHLKLGWHHDFADSSFASFYTYERFLANLRVTSGDWLVGLEGAFELQSFSPVEVSPEN